MLLQEILDIATNPPDNPRCLGHERPGMPHILVSIEDRDSMRVLHFSQRSYVPSSDFNYLVSEFAKKHLRCPTWWTCVTGPTWHGEVILD